MSAAAIHAAVDNRSSSMCDDVLPLVLGQLDRSSTAQLRRTSRHWKRGVECKLQHLEPRCRLLDVLQLFSGLQSVSLLRLSDSIFTSCTRLRHLQQQLQPWTAQLEAQQHLTSITISLQQAQSMGQIAWAHWLYHDFQPAPTAADAAGSGGSTAGGSSSSSGRSGNPGSTLSSSGKTGLENICKDNTNSSGRDVQQAADQALDLADMCQEDHPSAPSGTCIDTEQQPHVSDDAINNNLPPNTSSNTATQRRHSSSPPADNHRPHEGAACASSSGGRSSSADIDRRQGLLDADAPATCCSSSGCGGKGKGAAPAPARAPHSPSGPLLPQWYKGPYAALMHTERHVVLYVPSAFAAAGITHLVLKPPHSADPPGRSTPGASSSGDSSSSSSTANSSTPEASSSSSSRRSSGRCITPSWAELPCCLFLGAKLAQLESLEVHGAKLLVLPPCLQRMRCLRRLVLEGCNLQLSKEVFELKQLQELRLAHNSMSALLEGNWGRLCRLQVLDLSHNQLKDLPASLAHAPALHTLLLHHNQLPALPSALGRLQQLRHLDASHNWLSGAAELQELLPCWPRLQRLHLRNVSSKLGALVLPAAVAGCRELEVLDVGDQFDMCWGSLAAAADCKALQVLDVGPLPGPNQRAMVAAARQSLLQLTRQAPWLQAGVSSGALLRECLVQLPGDLV